MLSFVDRVMTSMRAGLSAFRESYVSGDRASLAEWNSLDGRHARYALFWACVANDSYRNFHRWAPAFKHQYGMYEFVRNLNGTASELSEFWTTHLMGGALDPAAGDGTTTPSALPIVIPDSNTSDKQLRQAIARLWKDSKWADKKSVYTRFGSVMGDVGLEVVDDPIRKKVYIRVVDPALIADVYLDDWGNVKAYTRMETRPNPTGKGADVTYTEVVDRNGDNVEYRTYLDDAPYDWTGYGTFWTKPYGFIPMVLIQHINVGQDWGWSELFAAFTKIRESDDVASALDDQIRIMVNAPFLLAGVAPPRTTPRTTVTPSTDAQGQHDETGRGDMRLVYGAIGATATPLVSPLDVAAVDARIANLATAIEHQYPEMQFERLRRGGALSGIALREARKPAKTKVNERRAPYDDGAVRAQQMGIAIGGASGYEGYEGFNYDSYAAGTLDHHIGERPVFDTDPLDDIEERQATWTAIKTATDAGMPLVEALRDAGWSDKKIADVIKAKAAAAALVPPTIIQPGGMPVTGGA